jgi:hypothetical protein
VVAIQLVAARAVRVRLGKALQAVLAQMQRML